MSGKLDSTMRKLAEKLLRKFGKKGSIVKVGVNTYDDDTGITTKGSESIYPITFYIDSDKTVKLRSNALINKNESIILISSKEAGVVIQNGDLIKGGEINTTIISFDSVWSGEKIALYEAVVVV